MAGTREKRCYFEGEKIVKSVFEGNHCLESHFRKLLCLGMSELCLRTLAGLL